MPTRRLSQAISEGDGISVVVRVSSVDDACSAEAQGAEGLAISREIPGLRQATSLPILWCGEPDWEAAHRAGADAVVAFSEADPPPQDRLELVAYVADEEILASVLEEADPEIFLLGGPESGLSDLEEAFEAVLDLLPDVPAGKLAIAEVPVERREEVEALERAGVDAVLVGTGDVAALVGTAPPEV